MEAEVSCAWVTEQKSWFYDGAMMFFIAIFDKFKRVVLELAINNLRYLKDLSLVWYQHWKMNCNRFGDTRIVQNLDYFRFSLPQSYSQLDFQQDDATLGLQELSIERCFLRVSGGLVD